MNPPPLNPPPQSNPVTPIARGCLKIAGFLVLAVITLFGVVYCVFTPDPKEREARMGTLEGRAMVIAEDSLIGHMGTPIISLMPQDGGGQRIKVEWNLISEVFSDDKAKGRRHILMGVQRFMANFYATGGGSEVAYFWFSPQTDFVDNHGAPSKRPIVKIMIDRLVADKIQWDNLDLEQVESIFHEEGTLEWHPAALD